MTASPAGSKAQKANPKSQKGKTSATRVAGDGAGIVPQPSREPVPMKPHKALFFALMSVFVVWVGVMVGMYFMTVRPQRHLGPPQPQQSPQPPAGATTTSPTTRALAQTVVPPQSQSQSM